VVIITGITTNTTNRKELSLSPQSCGIARGLKCLKAAGRDRAALLEVFFFGGLMRNTI